jgi:hypothetical protein
MCDGENNAAERAWRDQQVSHRNNSSDECQSEKGEGKKDQGKKGSRGKKKWQGKKKK